MIYLIQSAPNKPAAIAQQDIDKLSWRFPDGLNTPEDVAQCFAMVAMIWQELEDAIEVFAEEYDEWLDDLYVAAANLDAYAMSLQLNTIRLLKTASTLIGEVIKGL